MKSFFRVECSLTGHQFLLLRATLFKKAIEEKLLTTSSYTRNHYFFSLVVILYRAYIDNFRVILKIGDSV